MCNCSACLAKYGPVPTPVPIPTVTPRRRPRRRRRAALRPPQPAIEVQVGPKKIRGRVDRYFPQKEMGMIYGSDGWIYFFPKSEFVTKGSSCGEARADMTVTFEPKRGKKGRTACRVTEIPQPQLPPRVGSWKDRRNGHIKKYNRKKGFGIIIGWDTYKEYLFREEDLDARLLNGVGTLRHVEVIFNYVGGKEGSRVTNVRWR